MSYFSKKEEKEKKVESEKEEKVVITDKEWELREYMETYPDDFTEKEREKFSKSFYERFAKLSEEERKRKAKEREAPNDRYSDFNKTFDRRIENSLGEPGV